MIPRTPFLDSFRMAHNAGDLSVSPAIAYVNGAVIPLDGEICIP
jgi:hypothetical protein